ncbi:MAG: pilus assembly protein PilB [Synechococcales cyanobacterium M58_A2018_015]|nr:pilus assembly protein PilB [Synechococcales cyanobacterium M58_A2018_015]
MASPLDEPSEPILSPTLCQRIVSQFQGDWVTHLNVDQLLVLIDGVLPFEACLYYQVLPLFLDGNRLHLGMVSPEDTSASDYVRRMVSYLNYSLVPHAISSDALRVVLTVYLNQSNRSTQPKRREGFSYGHYRHSTRSRELLAANERLTLVVDSPDDLSATEAPSHPVELREETQMHTQTALPRVLVSPPPPALHPPSTPSTVDSFVPVASVPVASHAPEFGTSEDLVSDQGGPATSSLSALPLASPTRSLPTLRLPARYLSNPVEQLATLPPPELLSELLARVLLGGIGRLYFECHVQHGRVLWSQNGILQSVLDELPLPVFQGIMDELKRMAKLPLSPIEKPQQVESDYLYERAWVLLRFRFMPGQTGEEATLQVLRGAALKFYQQQQLSKLERDALGIAQQLQNKLNEIRIRACADPQQHARFDVLPTLGPLLHQMKEQLHQFGVDAGEATELEEP